jgi:hypothetical protein
VSLVQVQQGEPKRKIEDMKKIAKPITSFDEINSIEWRRGQNVPPVRHRYGGTSFNAVAKHAQENAGKFDGYIVLTDGECSSPGPSRLRRAWVIVPGRSLAFDPPKGDVVINMS